MNNYRIEIFKKKNQTIVIESLISKSEIFFISGTIHHGKMKFFLVSFKNNYVINILLKLDNKIMIMISRN